jgi:hypothetical protein
MINLANKVTSQVKWKRIYLVLRVFIYLLFLLMSLFIAYQILFPEISLSLFFSDIKSLKNTLALPRTTSQNPLQNGLIMSKEKFFFNANPLGSFENAKLKITTNKNSKNPENATIKIRKSYSAFFYPKGKPLGFANGSLLSVNGNYYIISNGFFRQFISGSALDQFGFSRPSFLRISPEELALNPKGEDIMNANSYPDDSLILVGDRHYQFKNGQLLPFFSEKAFLSRYQPSQAITKDEEFLKNKNISENSIGFADGTLASSDQSVFILSQGKSYPFADSATFVAMGFDWNDVIQLTPAELNVYTRQKQFTVNQCHPNGTLFFDKQANEYFLINNGLKHPIGSESIAKTYSKNSPIQADSKSLEKTASCKLAKTPLTFRTFDCEIDLSALNSLPGNDYQFDIVFPENVNLLTAETIFFTKFNQTNTLNSLSLIKTRLQNNYVKN